jgi:serine phosphatase RsbU (regulator of sigma subunit)
LFAVTDGLTEVTDQGGHMLGLEPIEALIVDRAHAPLGEIADAVFDRCRRHGPITDDQTLLLVRAT